jgi:hypothetical protein
LGPVLRKACSPHHIHHLVEIDFDWPASRLEREETRSPNLRIESPVRVDLSVWELLHSAKVAQMVIVEIYFEMAMRSQVSIDLEGRMGDLANVSKPTEVRKATYSQRKCQP